MYELSYIAGLGAALIYIWLVCAENPVQEQGRTSSMHEGEAGFTSDYSLLDYIFHI
jgi:hypothetical protein